MIFDVKSTSGKSFEGTRTTFEFPESKPITKVKAKLIGTFEGATWKARPRPTLSSRSEYLFSNFSMLAFLQKKPNVFTSGKGLVSSLDKISSETSDKKSFAKELNGVRGDFSNSPRKISI